MPELNEKFAAWSRAVFGEGVLDQKTKELIGIAASLTAGCASCAEAHLLKARRFGASDEEIREAVAIAEVIAAGKVRAMIQGLKSLAE